MANEAKLMQREAKGAKWGKKRQKEQIEEKGCKGRKRGAKSGRERPTEKNVCCRKTKGCKET